MSQPARTKREAQLLAEGKLPSKGHLWYGPEWGYKRPMKATRATAAINRMKVVS